MRVEEKGRKRKVVEIMIIIMGKGYTGAGFMCISVRECVKAEKSVYGRLKRGS